MKSGRAHERTFVSVIVPTRDRPRMMRETVESLVTQTYPRRCYEILVVDDSPTDPIRPHVEALIDAYDTHAISYVRGDRRGVNAARNAGISAARGNTYVFVDDDIEAPSEWLKTLISAFEARPGIEVVGGRVLLRTEGELPRMCTRCATATIEPQLDLGTDQVDVEWVWSGNMVCSQAAIDLAGPFDDTLGTGGDEFEWEKRYKEGGGRLAYVHDALIWHRRTTADLRVRRVLKARYARGRNRAIAHKMMGHRTANPWKSIPKYLVHAIVRRCWNGIFIVAAVIGEEVGRARSIMRRPGGDRAQGPQAPG